MEGAAAKDVPVAVPGGDGTAGGPAEGACRRPAGPLLGTSGLDLGYRFSEHGLGLNDALDLIQALVGDSGHRIRSAVLALGDGPGIALPHGVVVHIFDLIGDIRHIVLVLYGNDGQIGDSVADEQLIPDLQLVDVIAGVQGQQLVVGQVVVLGNDRPYVAALHRISHLTGFGAVEEQGHVGQIGEILRGHIALTDLNLLHKIDGDGVLIAVGGGQLGEQLIHGPFGLGCANKLPVYIQGVAVLHHTQGVAEGRLQIPFIHQCAAEGQTGGVGDLVCLHGVPAAQGVGDGPLHRQHSGMGLLLAGYGTQLHTVKSQGGSSGVKHLVYGEHGDSQTGGQEDGSVDPLGLCHAPQAGDAL